ncbi:AraC family transcriptional regulator [Paenibacillus sp. ATY16]|uniref:helix-turn-helix transcriptional regulator n=1 Tax=Paenibacillus sp. ATY16 TaxID=1759312 RepID=UPI00200FD52A|nr:AraC family transcriptional regulator [Paenibacillus sp. ATY16]MCK9862191.1 AraC family transcriptional regulator [Paenibacillus sp. ATY16]
MLAVNMELVPTVTFLGFVAYTSPWIHFKRTVDEYILYIIKSGELHIEENGERYVLRKGDVFMLEPNLDHEGFEKHVCDYYYIHFKHPDIQTVHIGDMESYARSFFLEDQEPEAGCSHGFPKHFNLANLNARSQVYNHLNEMGQLYQRKNYNRSMTALKLAELFVQLSRAYLAEHLQSARKRTTKGEATAYELLDYIHQHYPDKITGSDIEARFDCNFDYLNRIFNKITGCSITHYVNKVRVNRARELLEKTQMTIGEVAELVGFGDIYYFSKVFKKYVGLSPAYYKGTR